MRGRLIAVAAILVLALPGLLLAKGVDLYALFPNLTLGIDPGQADSVYVACGSQSATQLTVLVYVGTDNADPNDYLQGVDVELTATADQPGVTLDTTVTTVYGGSDVQSWGDSLLSVSVLSGGGNPSVFPLQLKLDAVELHASPAYLVTGDHLFATLRFNISSPTNITITGTYANPNSATLVTTLANGYGATVLAGACGPVVPTLSEWGLILFGVVLLGGIVWYLRRKPITAAA